MSDDLDKRPYFRSLPSYGPDWDAAIEYGIDMALLEENLRLTPQERLEQLMAMQRLAQELAAARKALHGSED